MGRAYEVRKASIQKTGAVKGKLYTSYAKEIYLAAKGNPDMESNISLKRLAEKAKKDQIPADIIDRAIKKAKGPATENYEVVVYEAFGPGVSNLIIKCLTDNVNRSISDLRTAFNKCSAKLGVSGSVSYNYDNLAIISVKSDKEDEILDALIEAGVKVIDYEVEDGFVTVSSEPTSLHLMKDVLEKIIPNINFELDETGYYSKDKVTLTADDKILFERLLNMLDEIDDVSDVFHNVNI